MLKVWVLAPSIKNEDENIDYFYDFSQSIDEYTRVFAILKIDWVWQPVNMQTFAGVIEEIEQEKESGSHFPVVFNLCDGDEINGAPGLSVVKMLVEKELVYTGADEYFYHITTSKIPMKHAFDAHLVPTADWMEITAGDFNSQSIIEKLGTPLIIKPAVSGGSMGVGVKNVVDTKEALDMIARQMFAGYRGWNLTADGMLAEKFICGPEFTTFITGSYNHPKKAIIHTPVQRVFHPSLPPKEQFLSFDRLWEIYEEESPMPQEENFYEYQLPNAALINSIKKISWDAFAACKGRGYTRVDLRMDEKTKEIFVLEVNAQCGLSEDENFTSIGAILRLGDKTFAQLVMEILNDAFMRSAIKKQIFVPARTKARA
ncbi:MAG: hypothetical protein ABIO05_04810 [Ferruginibacter sp.]